MKTVMPQTPEEAPYAQPKHCTYLDCLSGRAHVPHSGFEQFVFQVLMCAGMVTFMVNFNGILHAGGLGFYPHGLWMLPVVFCIALLIRFGFANRFTGWVIGKYIVTKLHGPSVGLAITAVNVCTMAPIMAVITTLLLTGPAGFLGKIAISLPISFCASYLANTFIVGPIVKMLANNVLPKHDTVRMYARVQKAATDIAYMLND